MPRTDVGVVVVTLNGMPWLEQCLASVRGFDTIVVDHGSKDATVEHARALPHVRVVEQENRGLGAGWNRGMGELAGKRYFLILNADAWVLDDAVERLARFADERPRAAYVGPKLLNPDGTLQRSVRAFPTVWRLVTEYFFLRKLAPRSRVLNAFYAGDFDHDAVRDADWLMGACMLVRAEAVDEVGGLDEDFFLFNEESDWCYRLRRAGWEVVFYPDAQVVHVGGATHGGRMFREQVASHLRFLAKHRGVQQAELARRLLALSLRGRALVFRGERGRMYGDVARWLASGRVPALLQR